MSCWWNSTPSGTCSRTPYARLSTPTTLCPSARSRSARLLPMKPATPVTRKDVTDSSSRTLDSMNRVSSSPGVGVEHFHGLTGQLVEIHSPHGKLVEEWLGAGYDVAA